MLLTASSSLTIKQISNFIQVDFKVGNFDVELQVFLHGVDVVENIIDNSGDDSLHGRVIDDSLHGVGLARGGLSISKYGSVVTTQNICKHKKSIVVKQHFTLKMLYL